MADQNTNETLLNTLQLFEQRLSLISVKGEELEREDEKEFARIALIIRIALVVAFLLAPIAFYLIYCLTFHMASVTSLTTGMAEEMQVMQQDFNQIADEMTSMEQAVAHISHAITTVPVIDHHVNQMHNTLGSMTNSLVDMTTHVGYMDTNVRQMAGDVTGMNTTFGQVNWIMQRMDRDVNTMSSPMYLFPLR